MFNLDNYRRFIEVIPRALRWIILVFAVLVILANVTVLALFFSFENQAAQYIYGSNPRQFYQQLRGDLLDDYGQVFGVAHNSGNTIRTTVEALAYGADVIEIDVVLVHGKLHAVHWSPLRFFGSWFFRGPTLEDVWDAAAGAKVIKLDLKGASNQMIYKLVDFLSKARRSDNEILVVSDKPEALKLLSQLEPKVIRMLPVGSSKVLDNLLNNEELLKTINGVSVRHSLLTQETTLALKKKNLVVFAWTVNDAAEMNELVEYGVDGVTTDNLAIMQLLGDSQPPEATPSPI